jgi:hypothetical protein
VEVEGAHNPADGGCPMRTYRLGGHTYMSRVAGFQAFDLLDSWQAAGLPATLPDWRMGVSGTPANSAHAPTPPLLTNVHDFSHTNAIAPARQAAQARRRQNVSAVRVLHQRVQKPDRAWAKVVLSRAIIKTTNGLVRPVIGRK